MSNDVVAPTLEAGPPASQVNYRELALRHGLSVSGSRTSLRDYVQQLWDRRHFIVAFSKAKLTAQYSQAKLGQIWQVATPLLNAGVFYLVFGVLLAAKRGVEDYIPFLVTGVFTWTYINSCVTAGVKSISGNLGMIRALHFPRASLPIALCIQQLQQLFYSLIVLFVILFAFGVPPTMHYFFMIPTLLLASGFSWGLALIVARAGSNTPDLAQLMPFLLRTWMYLSGVMYDLTTKAQHMPKEIRGLLPMNPAAVYIDLMRYSLIDSFKASQLPPHVWPLALGWALLIGVGGFVYFWRAEETYGRG